MTAIPPLTWVQFTDSLWLSADGRYVILRSVLPELLRNPTEIYTVRKRDPASARAYPARLGHHLVERYNLADAQQEADRDNWSDAQGATRHVPSTYPPELGHGLAMRHFYWPISNGCTRAALTIARCGDRLVAQVLGMSRQDRPITDPTGQDDSYQPGIYAEIELTPDMTNPELNP